MNVGGAETRCLMAGDPSAPALVLVHGLSLTSEIWVRSIDELARDRFVVAVDLLGHGFTRPAGGKPAGIDAKITHLGALLDTLKLEHVALCGSSFGALIAANLFLRNPDRIEKLIVNGSGSAFNTEAQLTAFTDRIYANYRPALTESSPEMWKARLNGTVLDVNTLPCELLTMLPLCYAQPWAAACWEEAVSTMRQPERFRPFRILDRLEQIDIPTLVVWGRDDKGGIYESAVAAVKRIPRAKMVVFEQCAHLPMVEHPEKFVAAVREFLAS